MDGAGASRFGVVGDDGSGDDGRMASGAVGVLRVCRRAVAAAQSATLTVVRAILALDDAELQGRRRGELVSAELGLPMAEARQLLSLTRRLEHMPALQEALCDGRLSLEHLKVINRSLSLRVDLIDEELQATFIELAEGTVFIRWARLVRQAIELLDPDGAHRPEEPDTLHVSRTFEGVLVVDGTFAGADAEFIEAALRAEADRLFAQWRAERKVDPTLARPSRSQLVAKALANLVRRGIAQPLESTRPVKPVVVLTMEAGNPGVLTTFDGRRLPPSVAEEILADCEIAPMILDTEGVPLWLGRTVRFGTPAQEAATAVRDGGCFMPGCTVPVEWTHMHHADWWTRDGGPTDVDNLPRACSHHHLMVHQPGWSVERSNRPDGRHDGWWIITRPDGTRMWSQRHGRQRAGAPPPSRGGPPQDGTAVA